MDDYNRGKNTSLVMSHFYSNLKRYEAKKESQNHGKYYFNLETTTMMDQEKNHNLITVGGLSSYYGKHTDGATDTEFSCLFIKLLS